ncbi:hypothetical protein HJC23_001054 [Cyclotella cryptica]|uniref:Dynein regulatory complex subunit 2 n=1 Tax=Cyclotella cryptica TaxID=29204 RepID=A0ABD3QI47_9STRA|eukprot:CCRYP_005007-RA/>CCRYP_005007-RA protein AED:0.19 eAED:0.19 QI:0/-1/0/1/-1/1/1/0/496
MLDENVRQASNERETAKRLNQELALSTTHRYEIESHWRQTLRKEKHTELHGEISLLSENHEQNVKRKAEIIKSSHDEFDYLQETYRNAMVANILRMDELIKIYDNQVILLDSAFRERIERFQKDFRDEVERINVQYNAERGIVQECILKQLRKAEYLAELMKRDTQHELEEIKNRNLEDINSLRSILDSRVEDLEEQFEQANFHAQSTDVTKGSYKQLQLMYSQRRQDIKQKTGQADRLQNAFQRVQLIAQQEAARNHELHQALLDRKTRAIQKFQMTKDELVTFRKDRQQKLIALSRRANERKESLRRQCVMADRVKKMAMACRKLETSRDQLASLLRDSIDFTSNQNGVSSCSQTREKPTKSTYSVTDIKNSDINTTQSILLLDTAHRFWDKYNMAQLDVMAMSKRMVGLKRREQELRRKLKLYQDGISVNDDVLKNSNHLLVINGKMNTVHNNCNGAKLVNNRTVLRRLPIVDANQIIFATHNNRVHPPSFCR